MEPVTEPSRERDPAPVEPRSNINDVASLAGVSRQTVSNVLNNRAGFSKATRNRVMSAMSALDYQPNRAARSLRSRRTMQLGYHMPTDQLTPENAFILRFIQAIVRAAAAKGRHILVFTEEADELEVFRELVAMRSVDGFILSSSRVDDPRARFLEQARIPFAMFGRTTPDLPQTWVDIDNLAAIRSAVDHLVARGFDQFAYVGYDAPNHWDLERVEGYRKALAEHGIRAAERSIVQVRNLASVHEPVGRLLDRQRRPNAIVTGSDVLAAAVVGAARARGLRPGSDIAVVGFDGGFVRQMTDPVLTSVRIPVERIAARLIERCLHEIDAGPSGDPGVIVPTELGPGGTA
jgi:DNA-binding LacI/PurR family transcriptional regulator